jgi:hypothetical protein
METSASFEARSAPSPYPTGPQLLENRLGALAAGDVFFQNLDFSATSWSSQSVTNIRRYL